MKPQYAQKPYKFTVAKTAKIAKVFHKLSQFFGLGNVCFAKKFSSISIHTWLFRCLLFLGGEGVVSNWLTLKPTLKLPHLTQNLVSNLSAIKKSIMLL